MNYIEKHQKKDNSNLNLGNSDFELYFWIIELCTYLYVLRKGLAADDD